MRYVLFGAPPYPVLSALGHCTLSSTDDGGYSVRAEPPHLAQAVQWELVVPAGTHRGEGTAARFTRRVQIVGEEDGAELARTAAELMPRYRAIVAAAAQEIEEAFERTGPARQQGIRWDGVIHALIVGWLLDLGVTHALKQAGWLDEFHDWHVLACATYPEEGADCGVRLQHASRTVFGELWIEGRRRWPPLPVNVNRTELEVLVRLASGGRRAQSTAGAPPHVLAMLCHLGILTQWRGVYAVAIPVFDTTDCARLLPLIHTAATRLATLVRSALPPFPSRRARVPTECAYRLAFVRFVLTRAFSDLANVGLLPSVPALLPQSWGLWLILEANPVALFHPFDAEGRSNEG